MTTTIIADDESTHHTAVESAELVHSHHLKHRTNLLEVGKRAGLAFHDGAHASQSSALQLLASIQGIAKLDKAHKVLGNTEMA